MKLMEKATAQIQKIDNEKGVIGYGIAWMLGVPVAALVIFWLLFGH